MQSQGTPAAGQGMELRQGPSRDSPARIGPVLVGSGEWTAPVLELWAAGAGKARPTRRVLGPAPNLVWCTVSTAGGEKQRARRGREPRLLGEERWGRPSPPPWGTQGGAPSSPSYSSGLRGREVARGMGQQDGSLETVGRVASSQGRRPLGREVRGWGAERKPLLKPVSWMLELGGNVSAASSILHRNGGVPPMLPNGAWCCWAGG